MGLHHVIFFYSQPLDLEASNYAQDKSSSETKVSAMEGYFQLVS